MKRIHLLIAFLLFVNLAPLRADEGMWLPALISQRIGDMQQNGFRLTAEDIYSVNQASLKDAVLLFGGGCTGELVSDEGLLLTNHHCGYSYIQRHSSVEHDYLRDGFWAMSKAEELPNKGLTVSFLERMEDVTGIILKGYKPSMSEARRDTLIRKNTDKLIKQVTQAGKGLSARVEALYYGNQYFLSCTRCIVMSVWWAPRRPPSVSSAARQTTGCGPATPVTSLFSASMPARTTNPLTIRPTMCRTVPNAFSASPAPA